MLVKTPEEIAKMRVAGKLAAAVLQMIEPHVKAGVSTGQLDKICYQYISKDLNAIPATLGHKGFQGSICTSINHVVCHGIPSDKKILKEGDIINIDVTVKKEGYIGDTSKMFMVGKVKPWAQRLVKTTQECLYEGIRLVRPGVFLGNIGYAIWQYATARGYSVVREFGGHGIGQQMWEDPHVPHYGKPNTGMKLVAGMTFTIEPMVNIGKKEVLTLGDGWTVVTKDHSLSAQWEHTLLVTKDGVEILTLRQDEMLPW